VKPCDTLRQKELTKKMNTKEAKIDDVLRETKHLRFCLQERKPKTVVVGVENQSGEELGWIEWYSSWRQYCYISESYGIILAKSCLEDITQFITDLMEERKKM